MPNLERIKAAQLEDAQGRRWWRLSKKRLDHWTERAKSLAAFGTAVGVLVTLSARAWHYIADRRVAPAELPAKDGERLAVDRVEKPKAP